MSLGDFRFTKNKDRHKKIRTLIEIIILLFACFLLVHLFLHLKTYRPYDAGTVEPGGKDTGFIALSYFGVDRIGDTSTLIGEDRLREHLAALKDQGYVTITQKDIENYYKNKQPLPKKSLFLMFEDGRRDTAIFAQGTLEYLNYKATMFTYPEKFEKKDSKFLTPDDLKELQGSSFWELGTNGYRLQYINVFDRYNNYIGEIDPLRYAMMQKYLGRKYNHYLMDYIRDKNGMPKESYRQMESRVNYDYEKVRDIYTEQLGFIPEAYTLMHSNTSQFGNNNEISELNEKWMRKLFKMNFNREGFSLNQRNSSIYDLTRMQPQPYWPVNHLLMRIKYDTHNDIHFLEGDKTKQAYWTLLKGASEIKGEKMYLTTLPESIALSRLKGSKDHKDVQVSVQVEGNSLGSQQIFLRANEKMSTYICVSLANGDLVITENQNGNKKELYRNKLVIIDGNTIPSVEEDKKAAEIGEYETMARYAESTDQGREYAARAETRKQDYAPTVAEGGEPYNGMLSVHQRSNRHLDISLKDDKITVKVDDQEAADNISVDVNSSGSLYLGADWHGGEGWSQRNLADDVYDAVFEKLIVKTNTASASDKQETLFSAELTGWEKVKFNIDQAWEALLSWFLKHL